MQQSPKSSPLQIQTPLTIQVASSHPLTAQTQISLASSSNAALTSAHAHAVTKTSAKNAVTATPTQVDIATSSRIWESVAATSAVVTLAQRRRQDSTMESQEVAIAVTQRKLFRVGRRQELRRCKTETLVRMTCMFNPSVLCSR